jgi:hypothetical protein
MFSLRRKSNTIEVIRRMLANLQPVSGSDTPIYDQMLADAKHYGWAYPRDNA